VGLVPVAAWRGAEGVPQVARAVAVGALERALGAVDPEALLPAGGGPGGLDHAQRAVVVRQAGVGGVLYLDVVLQGGDAGVDLVDAPAEEARQVGEVGAVVQQ